MSEPLDLKDCPSVMKADHIAAVLGVSRSYAYEIMEHSDFPLIRIGCRKRVKKEKFSEWLDRQSEIA